MNPGDEQATIGFAVPARLSALAVRYELVAEVGRGGMGVVYKARDRQTGDVVAVKVVHPAAASDPVVVERFKTELLLARRITHRNVCRVFDLNEFDGTTAISMEFVEGRSLRAVLQEVDALSTRQGMKIVRQIAAGLAEAHAQGVVHRDLKPENILIARDGVVKIMDFGIARLMDSRVTATGQLLGTPAYMSPEQAEGKPPDARSDIYSLGLVMYEMFCGRPAFSGETPIAVVAKQVSETPVAPRAIEADLPDRIDRAIRKCLEKNPANRFQSIVELESALSIVSETNADAPPADPGEAKLPQRMLRWQRSDGGLLAAAAVGLIVFFSVFGRVSLAPRSQVTFDRAVLRRIAEEHLQRLGVSTPIRQVGGAIDPGQYVYVATKFGAPFARDAANNPVHYWTWSAAFDGGSLNVDNRGRLTSFSRQAIPIDPIRRTADDARRQALGAVQEFFGEPASGLTLEREQRGATFEFAWLGPDGPLRIRYTAAIDAGGVSSLAESVAAARGYSLESFPFGEVTMNEWGLPVAAVIGALLCAFGVVNRRRAQASAPWRTALSVAAFVAGAGYLLPGFRFFGIGDMIAIPLGVGLLFAVVVYFGAIGVETLSRRAAPHKLVTLTSLFGRERRIEMSSLAILRGCAVGLVLLGADTLVSWIATTSFHGRLSMIHVGLMGGIIGGSVWPEGLVLGICVLQMVGVSLLVASADAVAERVPVRGWIASIAAAALLAASGIRLSMGAVQPVRFTLAALLVDYALLLVAYRLFDLLTLCAAIGTFAFWWANYPLLVMQQPIGAAGPWTAFALWTIVVVAAAAIAFRSTLRSGYRRVAAALE